MEKTCFFSAGKDHKIKLWKDGNCVYNSNNLNISFSSISHVLRDEKIFLFVLGDEKTLSIYSQTHNIENSIKPRIK